ncbi:MAG: phage tail assembly chaperone [Alphaproteobacteria bacterium]|nr:phage tail assembly chaperone [Alphaproteobacteria bacterium]
MSARWDAALRHAMRAFGLAPAAFWRLSLREWRALTADAVAPLRAEELKALMAAWPDEQAEARDDG